MYITKETYYAYAQTERPSGSTANERLGVRNEADYQDKSHQRVAFFTKNGYAVCEDGRWANGGAFALQEIEATTMGEKVEIAYKALRLSGLKWNGGFSVRSTHTPPVPQTPESRDKFDTRTYAQKTLAVEIAEKKAQIQSLQEELKILQGLVGNKIQI